MRSICSLDIYSLLLHTSVAANTCTRAAALGCSFLDDQQNEQAGEKRSSIRSRSHAPAAAEGSAKRAQADPEVVPSFIFIGDQCLRTHFVTCVHYASIATINITVLY